MIKLFLWIFRRFMGFIEIFLTCFSVPEKWLPGAGGRLSRSTVFQSRSTSRSTDVHRSVHVWPGTGTVDRAVDREESFALCKFAVDRAVDRAAPTVIFMTVGGRPCGRPTEPVRHCSGSETWVKNILINPINLLKIHKNSCIILH